MAIIHNPEVDQPRVPPLKTLPERSGGWFRRLQRRIGLALAGDDEELIVENKTAIPWHAYHNYHWLGVIDAGESQGVNLEKVRVQTMQVLGKLERSENDDGDNS